MGGGIILGLGAPSLNLGMGGNPCPARIRGGGRTGPEDCLTAFGFFDKSFLTFNMIKQMQNSEPA